MRRIHLLTSRPVRAAGVLLAASAVSVGLLSVPAQASAPWPSTGYTPQCDVVIPHSGGGWDYTDNSVTTPSYVALTYTSHTVTLLTTRVTDTCSGVFKADVAYTFGGSGDEEPLQAADGTWFDTTVSLKAPLSASTVGRIDWVWMYAVDRYSSFELSADHKNLVTESDRAAGPTTVATRELSDRVTYLVRKTYATPTTASSTSLTKGKHVTLRSRFTVTGTPSDAKLAGVKVRLQRRLPGGTWANLGGWITTSSSGLADVSVSVSKTAYYRFAYAGAFASPWNAPVSSRAITVHVH